MTRLVVPVSEEYLSDEGIREVATDIGAPSDAKVTVQNKPDGWYFVFEFDENGDAGPLD